MPVAQSDWFFNFFERSDRSKKAHINGNNPPCFFTSFELRNQTSTSTRSFSFEIKSVNG